jgi:hypothetical protein
VVRVVAVVVMFIAFLIFDIHFHLNNFTRSGILAFLPFKGKKVGF